MSEAYSESCYASKSCSADREARTIKLAAISLGTALLLSLICAYNLNHDVKVVTNQEVPYVQNRLDAVQPSLMASIKEKKGM